MDQGHQIAERMYESFNRRDAAAAKDIFASNFYSHPLEASGWECVQRAQARTSMDIRGPFAQLTPLPTQLNEGRSFVHIERVASPDSPPRSGQRPHRRPESDARPGRRRPRTSASPPDQAQRCRAGQPVRCADLRAGQTSRAATRHRRSLERAGPPGTALTDEITTLDRQITPIVAQAAPRTSALFGVGPEVAAQLLTTASDNPDRLHSKAALAHLCGAASIPASSGRVRRHRLHRGGDRDANHALHTIALCRMRYDQRTRAYVHRRITEGLSKQEILRCLKRYIVRDVYTALRADFAALAP